MDLLEALDQGRNEIVDEAADALGRSGQGHYESVDPAVRHARLAALYDLAVEAVRERNLTDVTRHCAQIAAERHRAGVQIAEVQVAFNVLEEAIWKRLVERVDPADLAQAFGLVSTVFGAGKDVLARTYVALATRENSPSLDLRALFRGTQNSGGGARSD